MNLLLPKDLCNPEMQYFMFAQAWFSGASASWLLTNDGIAKQDLRDLRLVYVMVNLRCQLSARDFLENSNIVSNNQFTKKMQQLTTIRKIGNIFWYCGWPSLSADRGVVELSFLCTTPGDDIYLSYGVNGTL